jgi:pyruvate/2-oxoglutarate dehydrogenase complex dihydrolipoamide dehydrogenase (E3) component
MALPKKLVVIAAGVVGCENAETFAALGTEFIWSMAATLQPFLESAEVAALLHVQ